MVIFRNGAAQIGVGHGDDRLVIGGADLNDFLTLDYDSRLKRYEIARDCGLAPDTVAAHQGTTSNRFRPMPSSSTT